MFGGGGSGGDQGAFSGGAGGAGEALWVQTSDGSVAGRGEVVAAAVVSTASARDREAQAVPTAVAAPEPGEPPAETRSAARARRASS